MSDHERGREAMSDFNALSAQLKKMPFLLGSDMTVYDFSVAAVLSGILFLGLTIGLPTWRMTSKSFQNIWGA